MAAFLPSPSPATSATVAAAAAAAAAKSCGGHVTTASLLSLPLPPLRLARGGIGRASLGALAGRRGRTAVAAKAETGGGGGREGEEGEVERALGMDGGIPGSSGEFVRRVSSRAYGMRRHLMESLDSLAYDVLETNPWREDSKPVYVLARRDNHLWTMKTRRSRSEIEKELGMLFSKGRSGVGNKSKYSRSKFTMLVEDIREGVLVFEDEDDAVKYCDLLQGGGQGCEGIAELEASSVFNLCHKMKALAVLFRRGRTPPLPQSLEHDLRARKRSLED